MGGGTPLQGSKDKGTLAEIEQALSEFTKGLEGMQLLQVLERVSYENEVDVEHFDRWTRIRRADGLIATNIVQMKVLHQLTGRYRRGEKVMVGDHVWCEGEVKSKNA
jgi:hypothetical protein